MLTLVTGGAGFIGSNFLLDAVRRHPDQAFVNLDALTYAGNLASLAPIADAPNYRFERADIGDRAAVDALFDRYRPDVVVHFAAESHVDRSIAAPDAFVRTNVNGTFHLLEAFRRVSADRDGARFHHVSTDEVYGSLGPTGRFREDSPYDPSSPYSASKAASDHLVRAASRTYGLPVTITSCSNNYGPRQFPEKLVPLMILRALEGGPLPVYGAGANVRDWLYVADHVEALHAVLERGEPGRTYNVGGDCELTNLEMVHRICAAVAEVAGRPIEPMLQRIAFVKDRPGHDLRYAIDASRIRDELGWRPVHDLDQGLEETVSWFMANNAWIDNIRSGEYLRWVSAHYGEPAPGGPP